WFQGLQHLLGFCGFLLSSIDHREYLMSSPIGFMERQELAEGYRVRAVRGNHKAVNRHWRDVRSEVKNLQPNCRLHQFHRTLKVTSFEHPGCPTIDDLMNTVVLITQIKSPAHDSSTVLGRDLVQSYRESSDTFRCLILFPEDLRLAEACPKAGLQHRG